MRNGDDASSDAALAGMSCVTFGLSDGCDYRAQELTVSEGRPRFTLVCPDGARYAVSLPVPGEHNVYNALAAFAALDLCGGDREKGAAAFSSFLGAKRRMEFRREVNGARVFEDYAHHPTELRATIRAARSTFPGSRVLCVFQPHTYSRTAELLPDFASALSGADSVFLLPIYSARETDTLGMSSELLASRIPGAVAFPSFEVARDALRDCLKPGDVLLITGAGDVNRLTDLL